MKYIMILLVILIAPTTHAQWEKVAWEGASVPSIIREGNNLYCATSNDGVYRSADSGSSWQAFNQGIETNHFALHARKIISTQTHFVLLTDAPYQRSQLFIREKSGGLWQGVRTSLDSSFVRNIVQLGSDTLIAGAESFQLDPMYKKSGIYISTDGGTVWTRRSSGLPDSLYYINFACHDQAICVSALIPDRSVQFVYSPRGVFRSTDLGNSWIPATQGLPDSVAFFAAEASNNTFFANVYRASPTSYTFDGVYRSTDNGSTWAKSMTGISPNEEYAYYLNVVDSLVFVSMSTGNYLTADNGATWQEFLSKDTFFIVDVAKVNERVVFGTDEGVVLPNDEDLMKASDTLHSNTGFLADYHTGVFAHDNMVYANLALSETTPWITRSSNNGETWTSIHVGDSITMSATPWVRSNDVLYTGGRDERNGRAAILRSTAPHELWTLHATLLPTGYVEAVDVRGDSILAAVAQPSGGPVLYFSSNSGASWNKLSVPSTDKRGYTTVKFVVDNFLIFDDYFNTYVSTNGGESWKYAFTNKFGATAIAVKDSFVIAIGRNFLSSGLIHSSDIYISSDAGVSWTRSSAGISPQLMFDDVVIDETRPGTIYFSTDPVPYITTKNPPNSTIFVTTNNGSSWRTLGENLPEASRLFVGRDFVYAMSSHGLYRHPIFTGNVVPAGASEILVAVHPSPVLVKSTITFTLPASSEVRLTLYDLQGRVIRDFGLGYYSAGAHDVELDLTDIPASHYTLSLGTALGTAQTSITKLQ